jgi:CRP/FNR family transcriptional regulator
LLKVEPFSRLPLFELESLSLKAQVAHHSKGELLYNEGDEADYAWLLQVGRLQLFKYSSDSRPIAIESIQPKQLFGTLDRLGDASSLTYPCTAVACVDSVSIKIPDRVFQSLYARYPTLVASACQLCSQRLSWMQERALSSQESVQRRVVKVLFDLRKVDGDELHYTKREISELAGTTVETAIRVLSEFRRKRWILSSRGKVTLKDLPRLQQLGI